MNSTVSQNDATKGNDAASPAKFYGWLTVGNRRTEIYRHEDATGIQWFARECYHSDPLGAGIQGGRRIASEIVDGYNATPEFCRTTKGSDAAQPAISLSDAIAKAAKLLRLAKSDNPNEAALAASKAQEIIDRYKLSIGDVNLDGPAPKPNEPVQHFAQDPLDIDGSARWKGQLAVTIARLNQCKAYGSNGATALIGRPSDVNTVRYLYSWLTKEIERLAQQHCAGCGRTYFNNFRLGAVEVVCRLLKESALSTVAAVNHEAIGNDRALLVVEKSLAEIEKSQRDVEDYGKRVLHLVSRSRAPVNYNGNAREAGRKAGASIRINAARGSIGGANPRLH